MSDGDNTTERKGRIERKGFLEAPKRESTAREREQKTGAERKGDCLQKERQSVRERERTESVRSFHVQRTER